MNHPPLGQFDADVRRRLQQLDGGDFVARLRALDPSLWSDDPDVQESIRNRLGWLTVPDKMIEATPGLRAFADEVRSAGFLHVALLGMGGSSLAPEVIRQTFGRADSYPDLVVLDTTDPASIRSAEEGLDLQRTLFIVASKSGTTLEALSLFAYFFDRVQSVKGDPAGDSFIAITDEGTPLQALARERGFRRVFINPSDIGGRYSALSYFGLVPAALIGVDLGLLLERAVAMTEAIQAPPADNPGVWLGSVLGELALAGCDKLTLAYSPGLEPLGPWIEQLVAESTGKDGRGILPVDGEPLGDPSVYGDDRVFVYLRLGEDQSRDSVLERLRAAGHPVLTLSLSDRYDLGAEFLRWETATATAGAVLGLNPFDEPNVAESKANTQRLLEEYRRSGALPASEPVVRDEGVGVFSPEAVSSLADALSDLLRRAGPGRYLALVAYLQRSRALEGRVQSVRIAFRDATRAATTLGYGPRYLHSTGQLHKGGGDNGIFLLLTADDAKDVAVPGQTYTFGLLKGAQALGDLEALRKRGRYVLHLHLSGAVDAGLEAVREAAQAAIRVAAR